MTRIRSWYKMGVGDKHSDDLFLVKWYDDLNELMWYSHLRNNSEMILIM